MGKCLGFPVLRNRLGPGLVILLLVLAALLAATQPLKADSRPRIVQFNELTAQQRYDEALAIIREEIKDPALDDKAYKAGTRVVGILGLSNYAFLYGWTDAMDREARGYFDQGRQFAADNEETQAALLHVLYAYYSKTARNGLALPYIRQEIEYWTKVGNRYQIFVALDGLSAVFQDAGELETAAHFRAKAMAIAKDYFVVGKHPADANEWLNYSEVLDRVADGSFEEGDSAMLEAIWRQREALSKQYLAFQSKTYLKYAELFTLAGRLDKAEELFRRARKQIPEDAEKAAAANFAALMELDFVCAEVRLYLVRGQNREALSKAAECEAGWQRTFDNLPVSVHRVAGLALSANGRYGEAIASFERAIALTEKTRASYTVAQRASFFRTGVSRRLYWGLILAAAKRAAQTGGEADFLAALEAAERIRARQLGELLGEGSQGPDLAGPIKAWRQRLPANTLVLGYVLAGEETVVLAFDRRRHLAALLPGSLAGEFQALGAALAEFDSDPNDLEARLSRLGQTVLGPVAPLLEGKTEPILLPDGAMNLVPFDILSADPRGYRPLVETMSVRLLPSLRFAIAGARAGEPAPGGIFAVGDPLYQAPDSIGALSQAEVRSITRGSEFLQYFDALPNTRREVQSIAGLFGNEPRLLALGPAANERAVKAGDLRGYRYLHFATHGILGGVVPGIGEPALVLAAGGEEEDGFLKAGEASELRLNADLTVLSACDTGSGRYVTGEGVLGMGRAFLVAGSRSVLVSLWPVETFATEEFMLEFYRQIRGGVSKSGARRAAALTIRQKRPHPAYWAPFILVGAGGEGQAAALPVGAGEAGGLQQSVSSRGGGLGTFTALKNSNVRKGPSGDAARIGRLSAGAEVTVLGKAEDWYRVRFGAGEGFIWAPLLKAKP